MGDPMPIYRQPEPHLTSSDHEVIAAFRLSGVGHKRSFVDGRAVAIKLCVSRPKNSCSAPAITRARAPSTRCQLPEMRGVAAVQQWRSELQASRALVSFKR